MHSPGRLIQGKMHKNAKLKAMCITHTQAPVNILLSSLVITLHPILHTEWDPVWLPFKLHMLQNYISNNFTCKILLLNDLVYYCHKIVWNSGINEIATIFSYRLRNWVPFWIQSNCQLRDRRALSLFKNIQLKTRRALLLYKVYMAIAPFWFSTEHPWTAQ